MVRKGLIHVTFHLASTASTNHIVDWEMTTGTIYWYDFETFGSDPKRDRAAQFAGIRTDEDLNVIGEPLVIYCKPANDFLPSPHACRITGITPQKAQLEGLPETEFIECINTEFSTPHTCVAGYNNLRFDDELTRQLLYRNFYDPYAREWQNGNSRWDIIDMVRLCAAVRPEGINWPVDENKVKRFRLEELTAANDIDHGQAHDALSDVLATISLARKVRQAQPKLYNYVYNLRWKKQVESHLDLINRKPFFHVSAMYSAEKNCLAQVMPLCRHPVDKNGIVVCDLMQDPRAWMNLDARELSKRLFTPRSQLPDEISPVPLKTLHINRCPIIAPTNILNDHQSQVLGIDREICDTNWKVLDDDNTLVEKIQKVFDSKDLPKETDPDFMIYSGGFFSASDRKLMDVIRNSAPDHLANLDLPFQDQRLAAMVFRYRARNYNDTLSEAELHTWEEFRIARLNRPGYRERFEQDIEEALSMCRRDSQKQVLFELKSYVEHLFQAGAAQTGKAGSAT